MNVVKKLIPAFGMLISLGLHAQQSDSALARLMMFAALNKQCDSVRQSQGEVVVMCVDRNFEPVEGVSIRVYCQGRLRVKINSNKDGYGLFNINGTIQIDSVAGYKDGTTFKCQMQSGWTQVNKITYILQGEAYIRKGVKLKPHNE